MNEGATDRFASVLPTYAAPAIVDVGIQRSSAQ
jgi:hypothetical protein